MSALSTVAQQREQAVAARFREDGLVLCAGTQDNVPISWFLAPYPRGFEKLVAKRVGCTVAHVRAVTTNRHGSVWTPLVFGVWDWRVCKAAMDILREFDRRRYWIGERACARRMKIATAAIRCLASNGHVRCEVWNGRKFYLREDLGLPLGDYRTAAREGDL